MTKNNNNPINVNDDITPITKKKIQAVDASEWNKLSVNELWEQRYIINERLTYAQNIGHVEMIRQIQRGLALLDQIITNKSMNSDDTRLI